MHGVTTALVAFILAGVIWPHVVKHKVQYYAALITILFIIVLDSVGQVFFAAEPNETPRVIYGITGLLQVAALVLCVLASGLTFGELRGEVFHTIDVVRRGGEKETIIVPLTGEQPKPRRPRDTGPTGIAESLQLNPHRDIGAEEAALDAEERAAAAAPPAAPSAGAERGGTAAASPESAGVGVAPEARASAADRGSIPLEP